MEAITQREMIENAEYIYQILSSEPMVLASWGAHQFSITEFEGMPALKFSVSGLMHAGFVIVAYNYSSDLFEIFCADGPGAIKLSEKGIYFMSS